MKKIPLRNKQSVWHYLGFFGLGVIVGSFLLFSAARLTWHSKFYPGVKVGGVVVAGLGRDEARTKIEEAISGYQPRIKYGDESWELPRDKIEFGVEESLNEAYRHGRRASIQDYLKLLTNQASEYPLAVKGGFENAYLSQVEKIGGGIETPVREVEISVKNGKIVISNGSNGTILDKDKLWGEIARRARYLDQSAIEIPTREMVAQLSEGEVEVLRERAEKLLKAKLLIKFEDTNLELKVSELLAFLAKNPGNDVVDVNQIEEYVKGLSESFNRKPQDAKFVFEEGKVKEFAPGKDGVEITEEAAKSDLKQAMEKLLREEERAEVKLNAKLTPPSVSTDKVNELGIKERIGRGESYYAHSIANRVYNVGLAASRVNSTLVAPGAEFSFNQSVGEITGETGYKTAYVISGGRTVLGDGGGVCQVSTTIFRAAMSAGLPITERWAHAYRVGYYEQNSKPGIDATVYSPSKDFKFKNDTPGHILIQLINDPKNLHLIVEIYGTTDGRVSTVSEPKVWGISPPPPDIYQDDVTVPSGQLKQVDWAAWGAKASFEYKVRRNGETIQAKTFTSAYRPWANVYLRGVAQ